jgi:hypothetical protein
MLLYHGSNLEVAVPDGEDNLAGGTMMDNKIKYLLFCMETYKQHRHMTGKQVYALFKKYRFDEYILDLYELLHIQGTRRLLEELDEYREIQERKTREVME